MVVVARRRELTCLEEFASLATGDDFGFHIRAREGRIEVDVTTPDGDTLAGRLQFARHLRRAVLLLDFCAAYAGDWRRLGLHGVELAVRQLPRRATLEELGGAVRT